MKMCENCGVVLDGDFSFATCPRCLLGEALVPGDLPYGSPALPAAGSVRFSQLASRPDFFQKYELLEKAGAGGQGEVWKVWDFEFRRVVAMKRLGRETPESAAAAYRFLAEAQITSQLDHPGILPVFDVGLDPDGKLFYTTQLLPGNTLGDVWRRVHAGGNAEWTLNRALELLLQVCDVVAHAHSRGVIHRDLKPANVLVGAFGEVRLIDWGSAHILEASRASFEEPFVRLNELPIQTDRNEAIAADPAASGATLAAGLPVTLAFAPPELLRGDLRQLGPRTDIYALGVMLYDLLAGRMPYSGAAGKLPAPAQLKARILAGPPPRLRSFKPALSRDLAAVAEKAMAHDPLRRYPSATDLATDLRAVLEGRPAQARRPGPLLLVQKWAARNYAYVLTGSVSLALIFGVLSFAHGWKVQRDSARQAQDVRNAEWAARNGHWRQAIDEWDRAAADGYRDSIYLNLQKAEAWTVLDEPERSGALLNRLALRPDLDGQAGVVLLRLGEHELFDRQKPGHGVQLVRAALAAGLTNADLLFAQGLLADSTPQALDLFHQALRYDPYHHGAHEHSLSLEFLLGHHQELANHLAVFRILYPDDPVPVFIAGAEAAMAGDLAAAQAALAGLPAQVNSNFWEQAGEMCRAWALAAKSYDVDLLLGQSPPARTPLDRLRRDPFSAEIMLPPGVFTALTNRLAGRVASLPCIRQGVLAGRDGLQRLNLPYLGNPLNAVQEIESGWRHHPEALYPALGGMLLEQQQPKNGPPLPAVLELQAQLYQLAADSPSMMPQMARLARYLAARTEFELAARAGSNSPTARLDCLANLRRAAAAPETSPAECQAYFQFALGLGENDLALQLVNRLEQRAPGGLAARRSRIEADLALGAFGSALEKINRLLADRPDDPWAPAQRQTALAGLEKLSGDLRIPPPPGP